MHRAFQYTHDMLYFTGFGLACSLLWDWHGSNHCCMQKSVSLQKPAVLFTCDISVQYALRKHIQRSHGWRSHRCYLSVRLGSNTIASQECAWVRTINAAASAPLCLDSRIYHTSIVGFTVQWYHDLLRRHWVTSAEVMYREPVIAAGSTLQSVRCFAMTACNDPHANQ